MNRISILVCLIVFIAGECVFHNSTIDAGQKTVTEKVQHGNAKFDVN